MPKETAKDFNARMVNKFPKDLRADSSVLFCKVCECSLKSSKLYNIEQHFNSVKHKSQVKKKESLPTQSLLTNMVNDLNPYNLDLCNTFLAANIPLYKINNAAVKEFLEKYIRRPVPSETVLRSKYLPTVYETYIRKLQIKAENKMIWVSLDETTDSEQRLVANFVFGLFGEEEKDNSYLLNLAHIDKANASSMAAFFTDSLQILWPNGKYIIFFYFKNLSYGSFCS